MRKNKKGEPNGAPIATLDSLPFEDVPFYGPCLLFATLFWERPRQGAIYRYSFGRLRILYIT